MTVNSIQVVDEFEGLDWCLKAIGADKVWDKTKGEGVKIAMIDTNVDNSHKELEGSIKRNYNTLGGEVGVGLSTGHGTMVAGLLVGKNTGVAPKAELYTMRVLDENGFGSTASIMNGITRAISLNVDVLAISLGATYQIPLLLEQRIVDAYEQGITIVSAVGNQGRDIPMYPSNMKEVIGVGGYDKNFNRVDFTNRGYDVLAPSTEILSSYKDGRYARMTGTSFASPLVAGGIALLISYYRSMGRELKPKEIREMIGNNFDLTKLIK